MVMSSAASENRTYLSGELARLAGVSADTLRHYERKGLIPLPDRSENGYRRYPASTLERVRLIRRALAVGFTLDELADILHVRDRGGVPCQRVRDLAEEKRDALEVRLQEITALRDTLNGLLAEWDSRLAVTGEGNRAGLLDSLAITPLRPERPAHTSLWKRRNNRT
jgi:DNA-binding transcriptional MerR regulator